MRGLIVSFLLSLFCCVGCHSHRDASANLKGFSSTDEAEGFILNIVEDRAELSEVSNFIDVEGVPEENLATVKAIFSRIGHASKTMTLEQHELIEADEYAKRQRVFLADAPEPVKEHFEGLEWNKDPSHYLILRFSEKVGDGQAYKGSSKVFTLGLRLDVGRWMFVSCY